jgi:hypothetical protein
MLISKLLMCEIELARRKMVMHTAVCYASKSLGLTLQSLDLGCCGNLFRHVQGKEVLVGVCAVNVEGGDVEIRDEIVLGFFGFVHFDGW